MIALATVARAASSVFNISYASSVELLLTHQAEIVAVFGHKLGWRMLIYFMGYLAKRVSVTGVVLLVDEAVRAEEKLLGLYPAQKDAMSTVRHALLNYQYEKLMPGLRAALVLAGLEVSVAGSTDSRKVIYPFILCEHLNGSAVVDNLFLMDLDPTDSTLYPVDPTGSESSSAACREVLVRVASALSSLPRALEFAQDEIRRRIDRTGEVWTIAVSNQLVEQIFEGTLSTFRQFYPSLRNNGLPSPRLVFALLYGKRVLLNPEVTSYIRGSMFVNSLDATTFPLQPNKPEWIELRSSIVSLNAAIAEQPGWVQNYLRNLFALIRSWAAATLQKAPVGILLDEIAVAWMRTKLAAATANGNTDVSLWDLLHLTENQVFNRRRNPTMAAYRKETILLPSEISPPNDRPPLEIVQLQSSFRHPAGAGALISELNAITLFEEDCFDYALVFLGKKDPTNGLRLKRIVFFDNKSITELDPSCGQPLPTNATLIQAPKKEPGYRAIYLQHVAANYFEENKQTDSAGDGLGDTVARGEYIYVYHTTMEGDSYSVDNVLTIGRKDS